MWNKVIIIIASLLVILYTFTGCSELVSKEETVVDVKIIDTYKRASYTTPLKVGKVTSIITHPAVYKVYVDYDGTKFTLTGKDVYEKYENKVGQTVKGTL